MALLRLAMKETNIDVIYTLPVLPADLVTDLVRKEAGLFYRILYSLNNPLLLKRHDFHNMAPLP
jgi:hypothetical protein